MNVSKVYAIKDDRRWKHDTVRERELAPLRKIRDNYEKLVLSLEPGLERSFEGIRSLELVNWLIDC